MPERRRRFRVGRPGRRRGAYLEGVRRTRLCDVAVAAAAVAAANLALDPQVVADTVRSGERADPRLQLVQSGMKIKTSASPPRAAVYTPAPAAAAAARPPRKAFAAAKCAPGQRRGLLLQHRRPCPSRVCP